VQKLQIWWKGDDFKKISLTFFNGFTNTYGDKDGKVPQDSKE